MRSTLLLLPLLLGAPGLASVRLEGVPHVRQKEDFCGEACVAMWLGKLGHAGDQDWVFDQTGLDPLEGRGAWSRDLHRALSRIGFEPGPGWYAVPAGDQAALQARFAELHADLLRGVPSVVCMRYSADPDAPEHFRLVLGYDAATDEVLFHEPAEDAGAYRRMKRGLFLALWPLKYQADRWTLVRFRLEGARLRPGEASATPTAADYAQQVMALKPRLPVGYALAVAPPFVVAGEAGTVRRWAEGTVTWAARHLEAKHFARRPGEVLTVWLFPDGESYRRNARALFGETPDTPYGYYLPAERALVMNIATGGGTLVHEIVHPYVRADFPEAPAWLNEGLGSLYEQSAEREGEIVGLTNWRLAGLQQAVRGRRLPSFAQLTATSSDDFYEGAWSDTNYAQARYLLYYLQERGLLADYYRRFRDGHRADPTGLRTLQAVLGERDLADFQRRWEAWVLTLRFEG